MTIKIKAAVEALVKINSVDVKQGKVIGLSRHGTVTPEHFQHWQTVVSYFKIVGRT